MVPRLAYSQIHILHFHFNHLPSLSGPPHLVFGVFIVQIHLNRQGPIIVQFQ